MVFKISSQAGIRINGGAKYTSHKIVTLTLIPLTNAKKMVVTNHSFNKRIKWVDYQNTIDWTLEEGDGNKIVYARFKNHNGKISDQYKASITFDTKPPALEYFGFDKGEFTNTSANLINLKSKEAYQMIISDEPSFYNSNWIHYHEKYHYFIKNPVENKTYTIYLKLKDEAGNKSEVAKAAVTIDRTPPTDYKIDISPLRRDEHSGKNYLIIDRAALKNNSKQTLEIKTPAKDAKYFKFTDRVNFRDVPWTFHKTSQTVKVDITNKRSFIYYVSFSDHAQNQTPFISQSFHVDLESPYEAALKIETHAENETFTRRRNLKLRLFALEADSMLISEYEDFRNTQYIVYSPTFNFKLSAAQGLKVIYARFKDLSENMSPVISNCIILDTIPPQDLGIRINQGIYKTTSQILKIKLTYEAANFYQIKTDDNFPKFWQGIVKEPFEYALTNKQPGIRYIYVRFADLAGNISETLVDSILIERIPIPVYFKIEQDHEKIRAIDYKVHLDILAHHAEEMLISETQDFVTSKWVPYQRDYIFQCGEGDGLKTIFIKYKSSTDSESYTVQNSIYIDNTPPQECTVILNQGQEVVESNILDIRLYAKEATDMQYAFHSDFDKVPWRPYHDQIIIQKYKPSGDLTVYARFKDELNNIAEPVSAKIRLILRPTGGTLKFIANKNYAYSEDKSLKLRIFSRDAKMMLLSFKADFSNARWEPYRTRKTLTLEGEDGPKTIYAKFKSQTETESLPTKLTGILDTKPPHHIQINIERLKWTERTRDEDIRIKLSAQEAVQYQISENQHFSHTVWRTYTDLPFNYALQNYTTGLKTLYLCFRDYYGNKTKVIKHGILIEPIQKRPRVIVNNNHSVLRDNRVKIQFKELLEAKDMRIGISKDKSRLNWIPYQPYFQWNIPKQDGQVTIYIDYRDSLDRVYESVPQQLLLTTLKPSLLSFRASRLYSNRPDAKTTLIIKAQNAQTMLISNRADFKDAIWRNFKSRLTWRLGPGDGTKTIYLKLGDHALNETDVQTTQVILDAKAPTAKTFYINDRKTYTNARIVRLHLESDDAEDMIVSNSPSLTYQSSWQKFKTDLSWLIQYQEGNQVVYVALQDAAGNISSVFSDTIILDTEPPVVLKFQINDGAVDVDGTEVKIHMKVRDAKFMRFSNTPTFDDDLWLPYRPIYKWTLAGTEVQRVYGTFKDKADNECKPYSDYIMVYPIKN